MGQRARLKRDRRQMETERQELLSRFLNGHAGPAASSCGLAPGHKGKCRPATA